MSVVYYHWVGTGSAFNPELGHTSFLVYGGNARTLLIDCGATVPLKLMQMGRINDVTDILITHMHADHIGGLEGLGFYFYYIQGRRGADLPTLHIATPELAHSLWENALKAGMAQSQDENAAPIEASLSTYFNVSVGMDARIEGLPDVRFHLTPHVAGMKNYGLTFSNGVFYSGDTVELPPHEPRLIFQDCQMVANGPGDVHISYDQLLEGLPLEVRKKTYLTHLGGGHGSRDPVADGFAGYVMPDMVIDIE